MTTANHSTSNENGNLREELIATFQGNFPIDTFTFLESLTRSGDWQRWIESKLMKAIFIYEGNFGWISSSAKECKFGFRAEQLKSGPTYFLDSNYNIVKNVNVRTGDLSLKSKIDNIKVRYENDEISFSVNYLFTLILSLDPSVEPSFGSRGREIIGQHCFSEWFNVCSVPPSQFRCWMLNKLMDTHSGVYPPTIPNDREIQYGYRKYATWFVRMVQGYGQEIIRKFLQANFMSPETFQIVSNELDSLNAYYNFNQVPEPEEGIIDVTADYLDYIPEPIISDSKARSMNEAFKISTKDRLKLQMLDDYFRVNGSQALHLSDLGRIVDLSSKSAVSEFLKRMVQEGLITLVKDAEDRRVVTITKKGYDVISAFV